MSRSRHRVGALVALLIVSGIGWACASPPVRTQGWSELRSRHFVLYSDLPAERARALAIDLERFRAAVAHVTSARRFDSPIPIRIFAFERGSSFRRFTPQRGVGGWIRATPRSYDVALAASLTEESRSILYHEYVHFVMRNQPDIAYPKWYQEGFAELLSTARVSGDQLILGDVDRNRASWILHGKRPPIETLLDSEAFADFDEEEMASFYAWAWLLVHYVAMDHAYAESDSFEASMLRYVRALLAELPPTEAFERGWGLSPAELSAQLDEVQSNLSRGSISLDVLDFSEEVSVRPLPQWEAALRLGELALHAALHELAAEHFEAALSAVPDHARALAGYADTLKYSGKWEQALEGFERAVAIDGQDPLNWLDRGEYWLHRAISADPDPPRDEWLARAREDFRAALELAPESPEAHAVLGVAELAGGSPQRAIPLLKRAFAILPNDWMIQGQLMEAYAGAGEWQQAERIARRLLVAAHDPEQVRTLRRVLEDARGGASR